MNEKCKFYLKESLVLGEKKFYQLNSQAFFFINETGRKILIQIENGATVRELIDVNGLKSESDIQNLKTYVDYLHNKGIISTKNRNRRLRVVCKRKKPVLDRLFIELTTSCNLRCAHCYASCGSGEFKRLEYSEIEKLICDFEKMGGLQIDYTGGEVFTHKDFMKILKLTASKNIYSNIFTNGTLLDEHIIRELEKIGSIRTVFISLDDNVPQEHDRFRGQEGAYKKTANALKLLKKSNLHASINLTIGDHNLSRIKEILKSFKEEFGLPVRVAPIIEVGRGTRLSRERSLADISNAINVWAKEMGVNYSIAALETDRKGPECGVGQNMIFIRASGEVCLCPTLTSEQSEEFVFGNIKESSISDIWYGNKSINNSCTVNCLANCKAAHLCKGGCRSRAWLDSGDVHGKDPLPCYFLNRGGFND